MVEKKKIAITGAKGVVGNVLMTGLQPKYDVVPIDLPEVDARDTQAVEQVLKDASAVIHLAGVFGLGDEGKEGWRSPYKEPDNLRMVISVLKAAERAKVSQFIHASTVHVEDSVSYMEDSKGMLYAVPGKYQTESSPSGYGHHKRHQEKLVEAAAANFSGGTVALRLGGVNPENLHPLKHDDLVILQHEQRVWLDHKDLVNLVKAVLEHPQPRKYNVLYAVSDNPGRLHDTSNAFGWNPIRRQHS